MCGKYHITTEDENISFREAIRQLMLEHPEIQLQLGEVRPTQVAPVYTRAGLAPMRFGYKPPWMKTLLINARSETAASSPLFSPRLKLARCLVPARGYFEWSPQKQPFLFGYPQGGLLHMAALSFEGDPVPGFVILTRDARGESKKVHPRMPLIFPTVELQQAWLHQDSLAESLLTLGAYEGLAAIPQAG